MTIRSKANFTATFFVDDELWQAAKARQGEISEKYATAIAATRAAQANRLNSTHRPRYLLSGLLECGVCGGPYSKRGQMDAALHGDLGTILEWAGGGRGKGATDTPKSGMSVSVVAGAGFEPATFRL